MLHACELRQGEHLLREGDVAKDIVLVVRGLLREYFVTDEGIEKTKAFVTAGGPSGSLADLLTGGPSHASIVAEETSRVLVGPYADYRALVDASVGWARLHAVLVEHLFLSKAIREYELLVHDAEARYARLEARYPGLETTVAAQHVASYLGITPVHLSRLRLKIDAGFGRPLLHTVRGIGYRLGTHV